MKSRRSWWLIYGICAAVVVSTLVWVTVVVARLERAEARARTEAAHQESLRLALWRMDSWLAPLIAREAARPYFDYQPFYTPQRAYTALLRPIEQGEILTPSPLLYFQSDYFSLHYQMGPDGQVTSPQAPAGQYRALAEGAYLSGAQIDSNAQALETISNFISRDEVVASCAPPPDTPTDELVAFAPPNNGIAQQLKTQQEAIRRKGNYQQQALEQLPQTFGGTSVAVGMLVPFWNDGGEEEQLIFARPVQVGGEEYFQGFLCDWPKLQSALLDQVGDLFADAALTPVRVATAEDPGGTMLATIPVALAVPNPAPAAIGMMSPARLTLVLTWLGVLAGMFAVAVTLQSSIAFGEKRSRFASAVTHELRTPLTTFRMYSEMLADDMIEDPARRAEYLQTLKDESGRLSNLVENVLAFARLEEGRSRKAPSSTTVEHLLEQVTPPLRQRAEDAGMTLSIADEAPDTSITTDADAIGQILLNLVDNACKYANGAEDRTIQLAASRDDGKVTVSVTDHGPGVPADVAASIFNPFDRGTRNQGDGTPGVGLGLALARGLARDLGGELKLASRREGGACFELTLPA